MQFERNVSTRVTKLVSTLLNHQSTPVSTGLPAKKYPGLHGYPCDIFKLLLLQRFLWAVKARERLSGNELMVFCKTDGVFAV